MKKILFSLIPFGQIFGTPSISDQSEACDAKYTFNGEKIVKPEAEWKKILSPQQFEVLRKGGTERAFSSPLHENHKAGIYVCSGCDLPLYNSTAKFDSGTGWPSFFQPICPQNITITKKFSLGGYRHEVSCSRCSGHLGDVFNDGPEPTGKRYCMDGISLKFIPASPPSQ